jgi:hypothetical protein
VLYFEKVGTFVGDNSPPQPLDADEEMDKVALGQGPQPHIPPDMCHRLDP